MNTIITILNILFIGCASTKTPSLQALIEKEEIEAVNTLGMPSEVVYIKLAQRAGELPTKIQLDEKEYIIEVFHEGSIKTPNEKGGIVFAIITSNTTGSRTLIKAKIDIVYYGAIDASMIAPERLIEILGAFAKISSHEQSK